LFLMLEKVTPDKAVEAMSRYGGTVLKTFLSKDDERELQDALHGRHPGIRAARQASTRAAADSRGQRNAAVRPPLPVIQSHRGGRESPEDR